jgi:uncharacterized DUF497 family protein
MISFDPDKRIGNLQKHGLDLAIAQDVLGGYLVTREDRREDYGEVRLQTLGQIAGEVFYIVHTPRGDVDHIISVRKADRYEAKTYWQRYASEH